MNTLPDKVAAGEETEVQIAPWGVYPQYDPEKKAVVNQIVDEAAGQRLLENFAGEILVDADHESENGGSTSREVRPSWRASPRCARRARRRAPPRRARASPGREERVAVRRRAGAQLVRGERGGVEPGLGAERVDEVGRVDAHERVAADEA